MLLPLDFNPIDFKVGNKLHTVSLEIVPLSDSEKVVSVDGRNYKILGKDEDVALFISQLETSSFSSVSLFKAKLISIGVDTVFRRVINESPTIVSPKTRNISEIEGLKSIEEAAIGSLPFAPPGFVGSIEMLKKEYPLVIIKGEKGSAIDALLIDKMEILHLSGSVRIVKNGAVVLQKGYGIASGNRANSPETIFRLASLSKILTVTAIMQLYDKKAVKLNDPISKYVPFVNRKIENLRVQLAEFLDQQRIGSPNTEETRRNINEIQNQIKWLESITIEHLITHQSGLPDLVEAVPDAVVSFQFGERSPQDYIDKLQDKPVKFEPGTDKRYNNFGYMLLAQIIEKVSGKSFELFIKDEILIPLEMRATYCPIRNEDDQPEAQAFTLVQFKLEDLRHYIEWLTQEIDKDLEGGARLSELETQKSKCEEELARLSNIPKNTRVPALFDDCSVRVGSGNVNSSILDLAKFEAALSKTTFLSIESQSLMSAKGLGWDLYGKQAEEAILGEVVDVEGNRGWVMKDGELGGGHTVIWRFPDKQASITMLCNSDMDEEAHGYLGPLSIEISKLLLAE